MNKMFSFKDYIIVYVIIALIISFMSGFFVGANSMKGHLSSVKTIENLEIKTTKKSNDTLEEIQLFYTLALSPTREWLTKIKLNMSIQNKDNNLMDELVRTAENIKNKQDSVKLKSPYLINANKNIIDALEKIIKSEDKQVNSMTYEAAFHDFLTAQKEYYRAIWLWDQETKSSTKIENESLLNWEEWKKASLHQKDYITASLLDKHSIKTFIHPEDIMVRIDTYLRGNSVQKVELQTFIELLISSESVSDKDFLRYKEWYPTETLPKIPNFVQ